MGIAMEFLLRYERDDGVRRSFLMKGLDIALRSFPGSQAVRTGCFRV
jgi:hypothetical protein